MSTSDCHGNEHNLVAHNLCDCKDTELLLTSNCHGNEHNSVWLVLETFLKEQLPVITDYVLKNENMRKIVECGSGSSYL